MVQLLEVRSFVFFCLPVVWGQVQENVRFRVTDFGLFTCAAKGFKCGYVASQYTNTILSEGSQDSVGAIDGSGSNEIWSNTGDVNATLTLETCEVDYCLVTCNFGCQCIQDVETGAPCDAGTAPPVTTTTDETDESNQVCPEQINHEVCPLLLDAVPAGQIDNYDCFNFCNGTFISSCDFGAQCGTYDCGVDRASTDGMRDGIVVGCTKADLQSTPTATATDGGGESSAGSAPAVVTYMWGQLPTVIFVAFVSSAWLFI